MMIWKDQIWIYHLRDGEVSPPQKYLVCCRELATFAATDQELADLVDQLLSGTTVAIVTMNPKILWKVDAARCHCVLACMSGFERLALNQCEQ